MQRDRFALAAEWRATAAEDARVARLLARESPSAAAFHAQQAAEKALKAACIARADDAARTHVINHLLDELENDGVPVSESVRAAGRLLERFYAPTRYPDVLGGIDPNRIYGAQDAEEALRHTQIVLDFVDAVIARERS